MLQCNFLLLCNYRAAGSDRGSPAAWTKLNFAALRRGAGVRGDSGVPCPRGCCGARRRWHMALQGGGDPRPPCHPPPHCCSGSPGLRQMRGEPKVRPPCFLQWLGRLPLAAADSAVNDNLLRNLPFFCSISQLLACFWSGVA